MLLKWKSEWKWRREAEPEKGQLLFRKKAHDDVKMVARRHREEGRMDESRDTNKSWSPSQTPDAPSIQRTFVRFSTPWGRGAKAGNWQSKGIVEQVF
jgi:hypothetical protein